MKSKCEVVEGAVHSIVLYIYPAHCVCDVIIVCVICGTFSTLVAIIFLLAYDCVMQLFNMLISQSCHVLFLEISQ